jgi:hypothetical protein
MGQGTLGFPLSLRKRFGFLAGLTMDSEFNHAPNDSPRSGSSKRVTPVVWSAVVVAIVVAIIWFATKA